LLRFSSRNLESSFIQANGRGALLNFRRQTELSYDLPVDALYYGPCDCLMKHHILKPNLYEKRMRRDKNIDPARIDPGQRHAELIFKLFLYNFD